MFPIFGTSCAIEVAHATFMKTSKQRLVKVLSGESNETL